MNTIELVRSLVEARLAESVHSMTAEEADPYVNKTFVHKGTNSHAEITSAGFNHKPHPDAVDRVVGTLPSGKVVRSGPSRRQVSIKWVETPEQSRGKGGGHAVMKMVTAHLDKHRLPARLNTTADLHPFYAKHGFVHAKNRDGTTNRTEMEREPKGS